MKKVKTYIDPDLAKKKIARYKYWSVKDETGVTICTSDENNPDNKSFADILKQVNKDNIDAEIQVRYGMIRVIYNVVRGSSSMNSPLHNYT